MADNARLVTDLRHTLIVSCQARPGEHLDNPSILAAMAQTVVQAGASAIRANGPANIRAIRQVVSVPIFGIFKREYDDSAVYITPTMREVHEIIEAGSDILTVDATNGPRPDGQSLEDFFQTLKEMCDLPIMADVSTAEEGIHAAELGADLVATTLAGYTPYSRQLNKPDFQLVRDLAESIKVPVIAEGRISTPEDARTMLDLGAYAVVVGSMITRPGHITQHFLTGMKLP